MSSSPDVSIIIPARNRSEMLPAAVLSCAESGPGLALQVVVIDDASTEDLARMAAALPVEYERLAVNSGSSFARNRGLARARGRYVKFLDSDDVLMAGALRREYAAAEANDADIVVTGWCDTKIHADGREEISTTFTGPRFTSIVDDLLAGRAVPTGAALYAARIAQLTKWDSRLAKLNDWDYFISAALCASRIATIEEPSYLWRHHAGERITSSTSFVDNALEFYAILSKLGERLESEGLLTPRRRERMAQYMFKELRGLYRLRRQERHAILARIRELDPRFSPLDEERSRLFRSLAHLLPLEWLLIGYGIARAAMDRISHPVGSSHESANLNTLSCAPSTSSTSRQSRCP